MGSRVYHFRVALFTNWALPESAKACSDCGDGRIVAHVNAVLCEEKVRLVEEYHRAALEFSRAARELNKRGCTASERELLRDAKNNAFAKCDGAHFALKSHVNEHGC